MAVRNVWKGMVIGALTGAATGLVLDLGERGAEGAAALGGAVAQHAPEVADHLRHSVSDAVSAASHRARTSDAPTQVGAVSAAAQERVSTALSEGIQRAGDSVGHGREKVANAVDRAKDGVAHS